MTVPPAESARRTATTVRLAAEKKLTRWSVPRIKPDPNQPRTEFDPRPLDELARNMATVGQLTPVIGYPDPADPEWLVLVDGERRLLAARRVPLDFLDAVVLADRPSAGELLLAQVSLGQLREKLSLADLAAAYARLMAEFRFTQQDLAAAIGVSPTKVSNVFSVRRLPAELQLQAAKLEVTVVPLVARLGTADEQAEVMRFANTPPAGTDRLPTRDEVEAFIAARKPARGPKGKAFTGTTDGRKFRLELRPGETHESLVEFLKGLIAVVQRYKAVPLTNLSQVTAPAD